MDRIKVRPAAWIKSAGWDLKLQRPGRIAGPVNVSVAVGRPDGRRRDIGNIAGKAILDLLVRHQVIDDDSKVAKIRARWDDNLSPGMICVTVESAIARGPSP